MRSQIFNFARAAFDILYPPACHFCQELLPEATSAHFCTDCLHELSHDPFLTCPHCAASVGQGVNLDDGCMACAGKGFHFERAIRMGRYDGGLRDAILRMKHHSGESLAETLGLLFATSRLEALRAWQPDVIIPMPLHWARRMKRGYNQSETVARSLAKVLQVPCRSRWLRRRSSTLEQAQLSATARRANVKGVFQLAKRAKVSNLRVLLVDDVLTTGATSDSAAVCVRQAGGAAVACAILARKDS